MRRKTDNQKTADKKGEARMKRYEDIQNQKPIDRKTLADDEKIITYWGKYGENSEWQEYEYVFKIKKK